VNNKGALPVGTITYLAYLFIGKEWIRTDPLKRKAAAVRERGFKDDSRVRAKGVEGEFCFRSDAGPPRKGGSQPLTK